MSTNPDEESRHAIPCPVLTWATRDPKLPAIITESLEITYGGMDHFCENWRNQLLLRGILPSDVVAFGGAPRVAYLLALVGAWRLGASALPLNPRAPLDAGSFAARHARLLLAPEDTPRLQSGGPAPEPLRILYEEDQPELPRPEEAAHRPHAGAIPSSASALVMTSGSSGPPKAARLSVRALLTSAARANANITLNPHDRWLLSLPLFHVSGLGILCRAWLAGAAVAVPKLDQTLAAAIRELRPTHVSLVATQLRRLLEDRDARESLRGMKAVLLGGSAMPEDLIHAALAHGIPIHKSYGLTEMCSQVTTTRAGADLEELLTSGYPLSPGTIRVSTLDEIEVSGDMLFDGYLHDDATSPARALTPDGWFPTGDLGRFDDKGRLIVLGRRDNMFISGGENIHPEEVERALLALPGVDQAMVVAVPDAEFVAVGFAFVELRDGAAVIPQQLSAALRAALPGFKIPKYFHPWPADLTPTGIKPSRKAFELRAQEILKR